MVRSANQPERKTIEQATCACYKLSMRDLFILWAMALLLLTGCDHSRDSLSRGQILSIASARAEHRGLDWGEPLHAIPPDLPDDQGRLLWQVFFPTAAEGTPRVMLVNAHTAWAAPAGPDRVLRCWPYPVDAVMRAHCQPLRGTWILVVQPTEPVADPAAEVARLNALAVANSLYPLFSLRQPRADAVQVVYGWQGAGGIPRLEAVARWINERAGAQARWIDLSARDPADS